jgi:D-alanyl-D-alanine carboxypeptidase (penicillin-binding protein 5/6)
LGLKEGQVYPLGELIEGALVRSGNDTCVAIGEYIGDNEDRFLQMMNQKAITLGARNSSFRNTNGMPANGHYSSAYDLAVISRYALQNPEFARIVRSQFETISLATVEGGTRTDQEKGFLIKNTNALLWSFPGADGVKTGTTNAAGACLVASATRDGRQLIAVVLKSRDRFGDAARLLDFGFRNFSEVGVFLPGEILSVLPLKNGDPRTVEVMIKERLGFMLPNGQVSQVETRIELREDIPTPLPADSKVGEVLITNREVILQRAPLFSVQSVDKLAPWWKFW